MKILYFVKLINGTLYFDDNIQYVSYLSKNELMFGNSLEEILAYFNGKLIELETPEDFPDDDFQIGLSIYKDNLLQQIEDIKKK